MDNNHDHIGEGVQIVYVLGFYYKQHEKPLKGFEKARCELTYVFKEPLQK